MADSKNEITPREFYKALSELKDELSGKLDRTIEQNTKTRVQLAEALTQMKTNKDEIDSLRSRSNILDIVLAFLTVIGSAIAVALNELKLK